MRNLFTYLSFTSLLLTSHLAQSAEHSLTASRCFASPASPVTAYTSAKEAAAMPADTRYRAPATSPRLETLDVLSIGISLDVYRQGQAWQTLQEQNAKQSEALHVGSILPMDPKKYPVTADDKDAASEKREADALELGLRDFLEKWPIPTVTAVRGWNPKTPNLRFTPERTQNSLSVMVNDLRGPAGLHWHRIRNVQDGIVCSDTPEDLLETLFETFERNPDLPALLVYANEGFNTALSLSTKGNKPIGVGTGPRQPGELTDSMVAMVVGRPERVEWLRYYAQFAKVNENKIDPEFTGWGARKPAVEFQPSEFIPQPWTQRAFEQWDALPVLAKLHRPVIVSLLRPDTGERLKREALTVKLAAGWKSATDGLTQKPSRVFFDGGLNTAPLAELLPALTAANSSLDLLDSRESYDLTQRLGDTGSASPFVGLALATMASYLNADTSVVMPMRRQDQATIISVTSPTPGKKPAGNDHFGVTLMPQTASTEEAPAVSSAPSAPKVSIGQQDHTLEEFLADQKPKSNWMDDL
ncbi:DUF2875 family protein [Pseudomonas sp. AD21]|uniref:type VI lipase adapter Tla3 domain-containing protein n=1 Tax=Pseudomonas sp. AD21 TaxID=396378 RepID=UPI00273A6C0E|nr:DUF2875 family protein [Pseudomonas sp. AD21]